MNALLVNRIKRIIKKYFVQGKAAELKTEGYEEIKRLIWRSGGFWKDYKDLIGQMINEAAAELKTEFDKKRLGKLDEAIKLQLAGIIETTRRNFKGLAEKTQKIIAEALARSATEGGRWQDYARRGFAKIKLEERHVRTELETTKAALDNLKRYADFTAADDKEIFYRYEGPATERPFCARHLGKVYSLEELKTMKNDFGQPAFAYCGGYNCRHRWGPVLGEKQGNLFIEKSWRQKFDNASKNEKAIMERELQFARKASLRGVRTELNYSLKNKYGKDADLIFDGKYAQLKQPRKNSMRALGSALTSRQADLIIIEMQESPDNFERVKGKINAWLKKHSDKEVLLIIQNKIWEFK